MHHGGNKMVNYERDIEKALNNGFNKADKRAKYIEDLSPEQLEVLRAYKEFYEYKRSSKGGRIKVASVWNAITCLRRLGQYLNMPFKPQSDREICVYKERIVKFVGDIQNDATRANWKVTIRSFYKWLYNIINLHEFPAIVDDIRLVPEKVKSKKKPSDLPTSEEIEKMLNVCFDNRDKAMIVLWSEMGCRGGEISEARLEDLEFDVKGCKLWINKSKSNERYVRLVQSAPYLRNWINNHPYKSNPKAFLFVGKPMGGKFGNKMERNGFNQAIQRIAKRAGINKRIYWHLGRFYAITSLQRQGFDLVKNAKRHGITTGTLQGVYLKIDDRDIDDAYCKLKDVRTEEEVINEQKELDRFKPKQCQKCNFINPSDLIFCQKCNSALDLMTALKIDEQQEQREKDMTYRIEKIEQILGQVAQNLQQPMMVNYGDKQAMLSVSGLQPFGEEFKSFNRKTDQERRVKK